MLIWEAEYKDCVFLQHKPDLIFIVYKKKLLADPLFPKGIHMLDFTQMLQWSPFLMQPAHSFRQGPALKVD